MTGCSYLGCTGTATALATERNRPEREHSERGKSSHVHKPLCHRIVPPAVLPPFNAVLQVLELRLEDSPPRLPSRPEMARIELQETGQLPRRAVAHNSPPGPRLVAGAPSPTPQELSEQRPFSPAWGTSGIEATSRIMMGALACQGPGATSHTGGTLVAMGMAMGGVPSPACDYQCLCD